MDQEAANTAAAASAMGAMMLVNFLIGIAYYLFMSYCLYVIGKKTNQTKLWMAWVPIIQFILMCKIAGKPIWWFVLLIIPCVNIVFGIMVGMGIAEARKKPTWWGVLLGLPCLQLIGAPLLAFSD